MANLSSCEGILVSGGGSLPLITLYKRPNKPAQTTSYSTYDEAWQLANGVYDNFNQTTASGVQVRTQILDFATDPSGDTLTYNNPFGNKNRWTDENGLQVYGNNVSIDNLTGIRWKRDIEDTNFQNAPKLWATLLSDAVGYTDPLGNSDYYMPPYTIISTVAIIDTNLSTIQYASGFSPNTFSTTHYFMSSTTGPSYTTAFWRVQIRTRAQVSFSLKTSIDNRNYAVLCAILPQPTTPNP